MEPLNEPDDAKDSLTKPKQKKPRTEAQIAATERMRAALGQKSEPVLEDKKTILKAIREKLNGPPKKKESKPAPEPESEPEPEPEPIIVKKEKKAPPKKEPKIIYESASEQESEEEVVIVKKKKKPKKKTIIYEEDSESEEEPVKPVRKERETKTQQNIVSKFKVSTTVSKPTGPVYYFAD